MRKNANKITLWIDEKLLQDIRQCSKKDNINMSVFIRTALKEKVEEKIVDKIKDPIKNVVHEQIKNSMDIFTDRIVKLIIKCAISAESSNYNTIGILSHILKSDRNEVKQLSYQYAIQNLKKKGDKIIE